MNGIEILSISGLQDEHARSFYNAKPIGAHVVIVLHAHCAGRAIAITNSLATISPPIPEKSPKSLLTTCQRWPHPILTKQGSDSHVARNPVYKSHASPRSIVNLTSFCRRNSGIHNGSWTCMGFVHQCGSHTCRPLLWDVGPLLIIATCRHHTTGRVAVPRDSMNQ